MPKHSDLCRAKTHDTYLELAFHTNEVLLSYLYRSNAAAYACGYVGLRPSNARPVTGPPDAWVLLPERDYWHDSARS
jgi:hypothetical protein